MSAQIISVDSLSIGSQPDLARPGPTFNPASFENTEAYGLQPAKGIAFGILLSVPAWLAVGLVCYFIL